MCLKNRYFSKPEFDNVATDTVNPPPTTLFFFFATIGLFVSPALFSVWNFEGWSEFWRWRKEERALRCSAKGVCFGLDIFPRFLFCPVYKVLIFFSFSLLGIWFSLVGVWIFCWTGLLGQHALIQGWVLSLLTHGIAVQLMLVVSWEILCFSQFSDMRWCTWFYFFCVWKWMLRWPPFFY